MFLLEVKSRTGMSITDAPESLQFTSILPRTLLVMMVPFLEGRLSTDGKGMREGRHAHLFTTASSVSTMSK